MKDIHVRKLRGIVRHLTLSLVHISKKNPVSQDHFTDSAASLEGSHIFFRWIDTESL